MLQDLKTYLDQRKIRYIVTTHSLAYTAQEIAAKAHIPGKQLAKTVMVKLDGKLAMAVVPASYRVDLVRLALYTGADAAELAHEPDFADRFPGCEVGAMPPFGNLWKMPVYVSDTLAKDTMISFNAGSHIEIVTLSFDDYQKLVEPKVLDFSTAH